MGGRGKGKREFRLHEPGNVGGNVKFSYEIIHICTAVVDESEM